MKREAARVPRAMKRAALRRMKRLRAGAPCSMSSKVGGL